MKNLTLLALAVLVCTAAFGQDVVVSKAANSSGTFIVASDNGTKITPFVKLINQIGYDVCIVPYKEDTVQGGQPVAQAVKDKYFEIKNKKTDLGVNTSSLSIAANGRSCLYVAGMLKYLDNRDLPKMVFFIDAKGFELNDFGTVYPLAIPPYNPMGCKLYMSVDSTSGKEEQEAAYEYYLTWVGFDGGTAQFLYDNYSDRDAYSIKSDLCAGLTSITKALANPAVKDPNPAEMSVMGYNEQRHKEKAQLLKDSTYDVIFIGNSITNNFEKPEYQEAWNKYYGDRKALNLGTSAYRTENTIWELENLDFNSQKPKLVVLEIGTNNVDRFNYPYRCTANELALGMVKIVRMVRQRMPSAKVILLRCFPGSYSGPNPTSHRMILNRASELASQIADNENIFYVDVNHLFTNTDGSTDKFMLGDWLHPTPVGAEYWLREMEPLVSKILGDTPHCSPDKNSAIVPCEKLEDDSYDWYDRHNEVLRVKEKVDPQIVLIGNSITHFWGGLPVLKYKDGTLREPAAPEAWKEAFGDKRVLNLGFGWDRTQNMLWRLDHGELDNLHPEWVVINAGTNNTSETQNARINTADEIAEGVKEVCRRVRSKCPTAKIILMAIFPREEMPDNPRRLLIKQANAKLKNFATNNRIIYIDISAKMLDSKGVLYPEVCGDYCHPTPRGYMMWADALKQYLND